VKSVAGVIPVTKPIQEVVQKDLLEADAIIVGTPVYNAMVSSPVVSFISTWPFENQPLKNKVGAVFVTAGGISAGEELAQMQILQSMMVFGMIVVGGDEWTSAFGASAVMQEGSFQLEDSKQPAKLFLDKAYGLGKRVATLTQFIQLPK
jgi:NAD(P)H dehydrogenase (quinone)